MILRGCLHSHSSFSDGKLTPQEMADAYESLGYDFIAVTDHDYLLKADYRSALNNVKTRMILFYGLELTVFVKGYVHVNRIEGNNEVLHIFNHIGEYGLSVNQVRARLDDLIKLYPIDAVEITSKGFRESVFDDIDWGYPRIASDDSHDNINIGRAWIEMDSDRDKDSIIRAVKNGNFWNCYI